MEQLDQFLRICACSLDSLCLFYSGSLDHELYGIHICIFLGNEGYSLIIATGIIINLFQNPDTFSKEQLTEYLSIMIRYSIPAAIQHAGETA